MAAGRILFRLDPFDSKLYLLHFCIACVPVWQRCCVVVVVVAQKQLEAPLLQTLYILALSVAIGASAIRSTYRGQHLDAVFVALAYTSALCGGQSRSTLSGGCVAVSSGGKQRNTV